jgi:hypothetical protein
MASQPMVVTQKPNKSLIGALVFLGISLITIRFLHDVCITLFAISGVIWAYQEIGSGVNQLRKIFGYAGITGVAIILIIELTSPITIVR